MAIHLRGVRPLRCPGRLLSARAQPKIVTEFNGRCIISAAGLKLAGPTETVTVYCFFAHLYLSFDDESRSFSSCYWDHQQLLLLLCSFKPNELYRIFEIKYYYNLQ